VEKEITSSPLAVLTADDFQIGAMFVNTGDMLARKASKKPKIR